MPRYRAADGTTYRRKNLYMPCALGPKFEEASEEEQDRLYKQTYWADNVTNAEWPVVLAHDGCSPSAKSRLKKKAAGWLMALARVAYLNPELFVAAVEQARDMYADQVGEPYPWAHLAPSLAGLKYDPERHGEVRLTLARRKDPAQPEEDDHGEH